MGGGFEFCRHWRPPVLSAPQRPRIQVVKMCHLTAVCGVNRVDGKRNESVYGRTGMSNKGEGMSCGMVMVKCWDGLVTWRDLINEVMRKVYKSRIDAMGVRGWPPCKWKDRVLEYTVVHQVLRQSNSWICFASTPKYSTILPLAFVNLVSRQKWSPVHLVVWE